jgi:membrane-bound lytic murein transglycosylase F
VADRHPLEEILRKGEITIIVPDRSRQSVLRRDGAAGFQYVLAKAFAAELGVTLRLRAAGSWERMIADLLGGRGDLIAASMANLPQWRGRVAFPRGYTTARQQVIVHRSYRQVTAPADLTGKTVHAVKGSPGHLLLQDLRRKGIAFRVHALSGLHEGDLIAMVAQRELSLAAVDSLIFSIEQRHHPQARAAFAFGPKISVGWAVDPDARRLLARANRFFRRIKDNGTFAALYARYLGEPAPVDELGLDHYHRTLADTLPALEPAIRKEAAANGFDWALIAALIYQESRFDPRAMSRAGAQGLMQLTATTAESLGVTDRTDGAQSLAAGVRHLRELYDLYDGVRESDRIHVALAAYNAGVGHVFDARNIARRKRLDPNRWDSLRQTLPLLSLRRYYKDAKYGFCRGGQPLRHVRNVMIYYDILKRRVLMAGYDSAAALPLREH